MQDPERFKDLRDQWNRRASTFPTEVNDEGRELIDFLDDAIGIAGCRLLDVGCGTGRYMAEVLRRGGDLVVGVEIADRMIDVGERAFRRAGFDPSDYRFIEAPWEAVDPAAEGLEAAFDIVIAINTPALDFESNLEKMLTCTRLGLCLVTFIDRQDTFYQDIHRAVHGHDKTFKTQDPKAILHFFETRGLEVRCDVLERRRSGMESISSILPRYLHWLHPDGGTPDDEARLFEMLRMRSEDGRHVRPEFWSRKARFLYLRDA